MRQALALYATTVIAAAPFAYAVGQANAPTAASDPTAAEFEKFRQVLEEDNPAELFEARGKELWTAKRGPKNASLEQCDLGLGPGLVKGAYVQLPRYFADADKVMDAERRIVHCMATLQGFDAAELAKHPFSTDTKATYPVALHAALGRPAHRGDSPPGARRQQR